MHIQANAKESKAPARHTSTLHFQITRGYAPNGQMVPTVSTKRSCSVDDAWTEVFYPFKAFPSGLSLEAIPNMRWKPLSAERTKELKAHTHTHTQCHTHTHTHTHSVGSLPAVSIL